MKQTNLKNHSARYSKKALHHAKRRVRDNRPLHRTIAFHPINFLFLLCAGVLLCASTFSAAAASYSVNGEVLAPIPTDPAVITSPTNNQQLSPLVQTVSGTCPADTYVEVNDNSALAGIAVCDQNTFQVSVSLSTGLNVLTAQDYNVTNNPGPSSSPVEVYYYPPVPPSSPNAPTPVPSKPQSTFVAPEVVKLLQVDMGIPYDPAHQPQPVSYKPILTGIAPPYSLVLVTVHTNPYYCHTYANAQGYWSCAFSQDIPPGLHTVDVEAQTPSKQMISLPSFHIQVTAAAPKSLGIAPKFSILTNYAYKVYELNQPVTIQLHMNGGIAPYGCTVDWGDGMVSSFILTSADYSITHTYTHLHASLATMPIKIAAVDTNGNASSLQIDTILKNTGFTIKTTKTRSPGSSFLSDVRSWLTVLWPAYLIILLMVFSFWLGEKQEMIALMNGKKLPKRPQHRHSHSH